MPVVPRVKIGDICTLEKGSTGLAKAEPGQYPLVATGAKRKSSKDYQFDTKAVCIPLVSSTGHGKKTLNYVHYQDGRFALGTILAALIPNDEAVLNARYLHTYLQKNKDRVLVPLMKGAANVSLSVKAISNIEIPLPSIRKQAELLTKIDSISKEHAEVLSELDVQAALFSQLRQAVLQEAIEGKLTAKWRKLNPHLISGENHASKLLAKILAEKDKLIKEGKIRQQKPLPPITDDEKPFDLPEGWVWCRLHRLAKNRRSALKAGPFGSSLKKAFYVSSGFKIYGQEQVIRGDAYYGDYFIDEKRFNLLKSCEVLPGDVLISLVGTVGKVLILPADAPRGIINPRLIKVSLEPSVAVSTYYRWFLATPFVRKFLADSCSGQTMDVLSLKILRSMPIPLPPLAEQHAIVERVDDLLATIDDLEKQVTDRKKQSELLMQSVLREAFEHSHG
jgi:type I restriction enzyme, S subunit